MPTPLERWIVYLIAMHSVAVGVGLLFTPVLSLTFGGWDKFYPLFFPRQAGVFHFILAFSYLYDYCIHRSVTILITAKATAFVFLIGATCMGTVPWIVPFSGLLDGAMGAVALCILLGRRKQG